MDEHYSIRYGHPDLINFQHILGQRSWPEFMQHDPIVNRCWDHLYREFAEYQIGLYKDEEPIAVANTMPLFWSGKDGDLPDTGLDWAMEKACKDYSKGVLVNMLIAAQILIEPTYRGKEISYKVLDAMKHMAVSHGIHKMALPVRPTRKQEYPEMEIKDYINMKNNSGETYDPWLRVHENSEGKIGKICHQSMNITGSIEDWEKWSGKQFTSSGDYIVDGALVPVSIDLGSNKGVYQEPNVWVIYDLNKIYKK